MKKIRIIMLGIFLATSYTYAKDNSNNNVKKIVVIGLDNNIKSNYYYDKMIAEEAGLQVDSLNSAYNRAIIQTIAEAAAKNGCEIVPFICGETPLSKKISVEGADEHCSSSLTEIDDSELKELLMSADAEYILVLNKHYLKYQDKPMQTVFHYVCFSLFDKNRNEILSDNYYFTCINPEHPEKIKKISRKTTSKMTASLLRKIEDGKQFSYHN